jgi:type II restriction enzyme
MRKIKKFLNIDSDDKLFEFFISTLKVKGITQWNYFVDWKKVYATVEKFEIELNILNALIGKDNIKKELTYIIRNYPRVIDAIPLLLAIRYNKKEDQKIDILSDLEMLQYDHFDLSVEKPNEMETGKIVEFFINSGLGELARDKKIKNFVDYATGVEVGIGSNGRKNRSGHQMEDVVGGYIKQICEELKLDYLKEADARAIQKRWDITIEVDKSSRRLDYVINKQGQLFFIEVNFYSGGGSKLKSTAGEYTRINQFWNSQNIEFIWITDGAGWLVTQKPLREYFDKADYLLNLEVLKLGTLKEILK